jgi:hypothetical protein
VGPAHAAAAAADAVDRTVTVTRTYLDAGQDVPVDTRTVSLHVSRTTGLRDRDGITVTWSGAHPTGGYYGDIHNADAAKEEYPMVLLQCRGVDSPTAPLAQRLTPETCFTQSPAERYAAELNTSWPEWRMDRYAAGDDLALQSGLVGPTPCGGVLPYYAVHVAHFRAADGTDYPIGQGGCAGMPPEMSALVTAGLPSNTAYGVTQPDGQGSVRFDVRTSESNPSLGCSSTVPCALVAVPVMGISCDEGFSNLPPADRPTDPDEIALDLAQCTATGHFAPGTPSTSQQQQRAVTGSLWWSASNWRGRVTVPLRFAPPSNVCDVVGGGAPLHLYGSELMVQAMTSWTPHFCLDKSLFPVKHVQTGEPQARSLLRHGTIHAALTSDVPDGGYPTPTVTAPIAMTGFTVGFAVDDKHGLPVERLNLTPRLLAKLLTESYPALPDIKNADAALRHNPLNILADPEFIALNPGMPTDFGAEAAATLFALSSDSDVTRALTSYLQADPDARAWLDGAADPWGMVVNPAYKGISLPVSSWPLLDTFILDPPLNPCLAQNPASMLNLIAAPTQRIPSISLALQYALSPSPGICVVSDNVTGVGDKLTTAGQQTGGHRFLLGVTSLGDAERFGLGEASLLSHVEAGAPAQFADATGRTFVAPSSASLAAAAALLTPDDATSTWHIDPAVLRAAPTGATAYPGAMLVDAAVPTTGLDTLEAAHYAAFLTWVATAGQTPGSGVGQLPPGYLPLTASNGLGAQADYTQRAATAVSAQQGEAVPLAAPVAVPAPTVAPSTPAPAVTATRPAAPVTRGPVAPAAPRPVVPAVVPHVVLPAPAPAPVVAAAAATGRTPGGLLGSAADVLPLLTLAGLLVGVVALPGLLVRRGRAA